MLHALAAVALLTAAAPAGKVTVVVMYFDNNTTDRSYDVLQKGLADMLVTDLAGVPALQMVEREKLQRLVDELKLQKTAYFDPKTAQKMGKGLGAQFAITGSIAAIAPQMRIDIRLIEVATAKIVFADKVLGTAEGFFDLQQELVDRFVVGLNVKLSASQRAKSGAVDVDTLKTYSQGLDSADNGDLAGASKKLASVVQSSPRFSLGRTKYDEILKRLAESGEKRSTAMSGAEAELVKSIDSHIASGDPEAQRAYRNALGNYLVFKMEQLAGQTKHPLQLSVTPMEKRPEVLALMQRYVENARAAMPLYGSRRGRDGNVEQEDIERGRAIGIPEVHSTSGRFGGPAYVLVEFILFGEAPSFGSRSGVSDLKIRPTLAQADPRMAEQAFALLDQRITELARDKSNVRDIGNAMELRGDALILLGRKEEAIASWQSYLDRYPTGDKYQLFEKKIQDLLGVSPEAKDFEVKLEACSLELSAIMMDATYRAVRADGVPGLKRLSERVQAKCKKSMYVQSFLGSIDHFGSIEAISRGDCSFYKEAVKRAVASKSPNPIESMKKIGGTACP